MKRKCLECGVEFESEREDAKMCSGRCRVKAHRRGRPAREGLVEEKPVAGEVVKAPVEADVAADEAVREMAQREEEDPLPEVAKEQEDPDAREGIFKPYIDPAQGWAYLTFPETRAARAVPRAVIDMEQLDAYCGNAVAPSVLPKAKVKAVAPAIEEKGFPYWAYIKALACPAGWRMGTG